MELTEALREVEMRQLQRSLAYEYAVDLLDDVLGLYEDASGEDLVEWRDLETVAISDGDEVKQAVAYLEWRGLLECHPQKPQLIAFRNESEAVR